MELDDLKAEWQALNAQMERQTALNSRMFKEGRMEKARHGLRPLAWGEAIGMLSGVLMMLVSASFWTNHRHVPHLLITGLLMHAYGLALVLFGARMQYLISHMDYAAPVLEIQRQLGQLRRFYAAGGMWLGMPWFVLWVPFMEMFFKGLFGADLYANAPSVIYSGLASGITGWLLVLIFIRWARKRPALAQRVDTFWAGGSLTRSQRMLDEIEKFESE